MSFISINTHLSPLNVILPAIFGPLCNHEYLIGIIIRIITFSFFKSECWHHALTNRFPKDYPIFGSCYFNSSPVIIISSPKSFSKGLKFRRNHFSVKLPKCGQKPKTCLWGMRTTHQANKF